MLIAFLLAAYFILFGANHHLYGISPDEFLCQVNEQTGDNIDADLKQQQSRMRVLLQDYRAKRKHSSNPVIQQALEREIQKIVSVIGDAPMEEDKFMSLEKAKHEATQESQRASGLNAIDWLSYA